jgi:hypothetical protein
VQQNQGRQNQQHLFCHHKPVHKATLLSDVILEGISPQQFIGCCNVVFFFVFCLAFFRVVKAAGNTITD